MKKKKAVNAVALILVPVMMIVTGVLCLKLHELNVLPNKLFVIIILLAASFILLMLLLLMNFSGSFRNIVGVFLAAVFLVGAVYAIVQMGRFQAAADSIIETEEVKVSEMAVYVRADDSAQSLSDIKDYRIGIMEVQDRDVSDATLQRISSELGVTLDVMVFDGPIQLVQGLLDDDVDAILFNSVLMSLLAEQDQYAELLSSLREVSTMVIRTTRTVKKDNNSSTDAQGNKNSASKKGKKIAENGVPEVITVYVTGIDTYGSIGNTSRSDVNIIVSINTVTHQIAMVSTPRDYYIPLSISGGMEDKLTHAGIYGVDVSMATLEMLYDVDFDYYFRVNFSGFEEIVDAIGGVTVDNEVAFTAFHETDYFEQGQIELDGHRALLYVRERHAFGDGDFARGRHQMQVIKAIAEKVMSPEILTSYGDLLEAAENNFETNIPYDVISELVKQQLQTGAEWTFNSMNAAGYNSAGACWSTGSEQLSVVMPDYDSVEECRKFLESNR